MIGMLGSIVFEASSKKIMTINDMDVSENARWQKHEVNNVRSRLEFIGDEGREITLKIGLKAINGVNPKKVLQEFRDMKINGAVEPFLLGSEIIGKFVIESMSYSYKFIDKNGIPWDIALSLKLSEYCEETLEDVKKTNNTYKETSIRTLNYTTGQRR